MIQHLRPHRGRLALTLAAVGLAACSSNSPRTDDGPIPKLLEKPQPDSIGKVLADMDASISRWATLTMTASSSAEQREARMLEALLVDTASQRLAELVHELQIGPPINRMRAAAALGFSRSAEAQGPLLAALSDHSPDVTHNALLGLAVLGRGDTPLEPICEQFERSVDAQTRAQAAWAMRAIVGAGGSSPMVTATARRGLVDTEPLVRAQCALTLGLLADNDSVRAIGDLVFDDVALVSQGAIEALVRIAQKDPSQKGPVGRRLVEALDKGNSQLQRRAKEGLVQIADVNYGSDVQAWLEWANRLP